MLFATLHSADSWREEGIYEVTIGLFIISMSLFFISNISWISMILGITPY